MPGANILEKGTTIGTQTDFDGNFSISIGDDNAVLVVSYIGFATQEVPINGRKIVDITLEESASALQEIVVVGYGTQSKVKVTGSISSVTGEDVVKNTTSNISSALSGRLAGLATIQSSGEPGADISSLRIRGQSTPGSNAPLILVDGIPRDLNSVNPSDIENISILKDAASAAIYGMRAANGDLLITTKRGGSEKPTVSFNSLWLSSVDVMPFLLVAMK